jgi:outer membrane protein insertion porin family
MTNRANYWKTIYYVLPLAVIFLLAGCGTTKHIPEGEYLLRKNRIKITSDRVMTDKGETQDILAHLAVQKPNDYALFGHFPVKLWLFNRKYEKLRYTPDSSLPKLTQRPVILDTSLNARSMFFMKSYLFNKGYFYAQIKDTVRYWKKRAYVTYNVNVGTNYLINKVIYDVDDSGIAWILRNFSEGSVLEKGMEFSYNLLEVERSMITNTFRNNGYYRFSQENITFQIDTVVSTFFKMAENPFENAINFLAQSKSNEKPTLDVHVIIRRGEDTSAYNQYRISTVNIFPDYEGLVSTTDSSFQRLSVGQMNFFYHQYYVHPKVLHDHIFLSPGSLYSQANYDKTNMKLNELGIFQYSRVQFRENRAKRTLEANILMQRTKKYDFLRNLEITNGSTYFLGTSLELTLINRNFMKGANLLMLSASGGVELLNNKSTDRTFWNNIGILTRYYNLKGSLDFPKFLAPFSSRLFQKSNLPHTIVSGGLSVIERLVYFTMSNVSSSFAYSWRETETKTWGFSPAFVNIINVSPTDSFNKTLSKNKYLANTYSENFIEGENISFRFNNREKRRGINSSSLTLSFEEAGGLLSGINQVGTTYDLYDLQYAQYVKFDFDAAHYFTLPRSSFAFRFYGGIGIPYANSTVLPYIKQYFAGGPFSLRGWNFRSIGPGSFVFVDSSGEVQDKAVSAIDRTGDIKLEFNGEYRFPIAPLFKGAAKMNGAIFMDMGNIWVAQKTSDFPGGEFALYKLWQDIAMDVGVGARFDFLSFLTIRTDFAIPIKKPYVPTNDGWLFKQGPNCLQFNQIVPQITIGYPF